TRPRLPLVLRRNVRCTARQVSDVTDRRLYHVVAAEVRGDLLRLRGGLDDHEPTCARRTVRSALLPCCHRAARTFPLARHVALFDRHVYRPVAWTRSHTGSHILDERLVTSGDDPSARAARSHVLPGRRGALRRARRASPACGDRRYAAPVRPSG